MRYRVKSIFCLVCVCLSVLVFLCWLLFHEKPLTDSELKIIAKEIHINLPLPSHSRLDIHCHGGHRSSTRLEVRIECHAQEVSRILELWEKIDHKNIGDTPQYGKDWRDIKPFDDWQRIKPFKEADSAYLISGEDNLFAFVQIRDSLAVIYIETRGNPEDFAEELLPMMEKGKQEFILGPCFEYIRKWP